MSQGSLFLVSVGPGLADYIPPAAERALRASDVVVAYPLYLSWVQPWIEGKEIISTGMTGEKERVAAALAAARAGRCAALVSSGDIGIYAMAGLAFEMLEAEDTFPVEVIPGISACQAAASLLGAPLTHDFATLSLSDLLFPWDQIEARARALAGVGMVTALYNVQSKERTEGIRSVLRIYAEAQGDDIWCGAVRNAFRETQEVRIGTLKELQGWEFDMLTTIILGNRWTKKLGNRIYNPRGYGGWKDSESSADSPVPSEPCVWVFGGTSDANDVAGRLAAAGYRVVLSVLSSMGRDCAATSSGIQVRVGRLGAEARRRELKRTGARVIVDATHPYAEGMSRQLVEAAKELQLPLVRYERPSSPIPEEAIVCADAEQTAAAAIARGGRIFLATGARHLDLFLRAPGAEKVEWFARTAADPASLQRALELGLPRERIICQQGPFSSAFNAALWREWGITTVVTKESGEAGGFPSKAEAAREVGAKLVVWRRPVLEYPTKVSSPAAVVQSVAAQWGAGSVAVR
jgi:precorrin-3B C17-methyltransferase